MLAKMKTNYDSKIDGQMLWDNILYDKRVTWKEDGSLVLMGLGQGMGLPQPWKEICRNPLAEIAEITGLQPLNIMVNRLPGGVVVPVHTDTVPGNPERWHLPLVTDPTTCYFWDEVVGMRTMPTGQWYRVNYRVRHTILNFGSVERVHLVVDMK